MPRFLSLLFVSVFAILISSSEAAERPNVILIFIDDLGWKDVGCYGNDFVETPHIDQLAKEGMRFTSFYASGAVCSPTRCAVQSGQNQARIGITAHIPGHWRPFERVITPLTAMSTPLDTVTVAETLKTTGYRTGYIGKWHLGGGREFQPEHQGYDFPVVIGGPHLPGKYRAAGPIQPEEGQYRTEFESDLSVRFIEESKDGPFFLMVSPFAVHIPLGAMSEKVEKYRRKAEETGRDLPSPIYAAMVEHCDDLVGEIVGAVEKRGITDNTMILFTSDNGGLYRRYDYREAADDNVTSLKPLKGEKGSLHEGGIRVPLIVKYPGVVPPNTESDEVTVSHDFYPTFAELAGASLPANQTIDGVSLLPVLKDPAANLEREAIYFHYPHYHHDRPASAIRTREWKLIEYLDNTGDIELYDIVNDIGETTDLADEKKGRKADLLKKLNAWRESVAARMPIPNPNFDPERAPEWWNMRTGESVDSDSRKRFPPTEKDL